MENITRFNRKNIDDRQIDTLIGISKGLLADGKVDQKEAEFLLGWLIQAKQCSKNPIISNLLQQLEIMLEDGILDQEESAELFNTLQMITGEKSEIGELAKPSTLPLDTPTPEIIFPESTFLFTGTFAYGSRAQCQDITKSLGGKTSKNVTKNTDYLVIGSYVSDSWIHETFGRKIEKAVDYRNNGIRIKIVSEKDWADSGNF